MHTSTHERNGGQHAIGAPGGLREDGVLCILQNVVPPIYAAGTMYSLVLFVLFCSKLEELDAPIRPPPQFRLRWRVCSSFHTLVDRVENVQSKDVTAI